MTTKQVDWKAFAGLVEGDLERAYLIRSDLDGAFSTVRAIILDNLEVYVDKPFINRFRVKIESFGRVIKIDLEHELETLCHWDVSCRV